MTPKPIQGKSGPTSRRNEKQPKGKSPSGSGATASVKTNKAGTKGPQVAKTRPPTQKPLTRAQRKQKYTNDSLNNTQAEESAKTDNAMDKIAEAKEKAEAAKLEELACAEIRVSRELTKLNITFDAPDNSYRRIAMIVLLCVCLFLVLITEFLLVMNTNGEWNTNAVPSTELTRYSEPEKDMRFISAVNTMSIVLSFIFIIILLPMLTTRAPTKKVSYKYVPFPLIATEGGMDNHGVSTRPEEPDCDMRGDSNARTKIKHGQKTFLVSVQQRKYFFPWFKLRCLESNSKTTMIVCGELLTQALCAGVLSGLSTIPDKMKAVEGAIRRNCSVNQDRTSWFSGQSTYNNTISLAKAIIIADEQRRTRLLPDLGFH